VDRRAGYSHQINARPDERRVPEWLDSAIDLYLNKFATRSSSIWVHDEWPLWISSTTRSPNDHKKTSVTLISKVTLETLGVDVLTSPLPHCCSFYRGIYGGSTPPPRQRPY